jgi:hypothetical protein
MLSFLTIVFYALAGKPADFLKLKRISCRQKTSVEPLYRTSSDGPAGALVADQEEGVKRTGTPWLAR